MKTEQEIRTEEVKALREIFLTDGEKALNGVISQHFDELLNIVRTLGNRYEKLTAELDDTPERIKYLKDYHTGLFGLLTKYQDAVRNYDPETLFAGYFKIVEDHTGTLPSIITRKEIFKIYKLRWNDPVSKNRKKITANSRFYLFQFYLSLINFFRKIWRRSPHDTNVYLTRKIPFRNMAVYYLGSDLLPDMTGILESFMKTKSQVLEKLWTLNAKTDEVLQLMMAGGDTKELTETLNSGQTGDVFNEARQEISSSRAELKNMSKRVLEDAFAKFDQACGIVNTPDLPVRSFLSAGLTLHKEAAVTNQVQLLERWKNTHVTLFDDWLVDVEVVLLYYAVLADFSKLKEKTEAFVSTGLLQNLDQLTAFIGSSAERIEADAVSVKKASATLLAERKTINEQLIDNMLTGTIGLLSGNVTDDIRQFRLRAMKFADRVSGKRGFIRSGNYNRSIRSSEINYLSPRELLNFEAIPLFEKAIDEVSLAVENSLEKARLKLISSGTVCDFSLESAQLLLEQRKGYKAAWHVAEEGYQRAVKNISEAREVILTISSEPLEELNTAVHEFNARIQKLKNSDNILELNLQIARIKAVEHSRKARKEAAQLVRNLLPASVKYIKNKAVQTSSVVDNLRAKMGIAGTKKGISYEVSEFITHAETSLKKLPFVYQRLYQLNPTDEDRFFVNRTKELALLKGAYDDWKMDRFVTTAVIGEKGSGITSLITYFLHKLESDDVIIYHTVDQKIFQPEKYYSFFARLFEQEQFVSNEDIIGFLNKQHEKRIVILENLQHFFLKKVNGLDGQRMLFDLIVNTAKKVFWVCSYTAQSWDYLDRVIHISDHFVREIRLEPMDSSSLQEIIYKRNNLSGYKVKFEAVEGSEESRNWSRMDEKLQQDTLRTRFFNELTLRSSGNVSLAQLYWLHSTRSVTEDTITIGSSFGIDLSFIRDIKAEYLFALHALLIHDGLTLEAYAAVYDLPVAECRNILVPMMEKGLLIRPREKYNINPIVFRQVVNLLRSRNFIS